jgi:DNA-binding NtrC family response regulator
MKIRILLVDDEKDFVETLAERLRTRGFHVTEAFNGEEALEKLKEYNFDVTILDVQMPGISGIEALEAIKKLKPLTEVLMLTGHGTIETAIDGMKLGAFDFLMKPCDMEVLMEKINKAYERKLEHEERIRKAFADKISTSPMSIFEK